MAISIFKGEARYFHAERDANNASKACTNLYLLPLKSAPPPLQKLILALDFIFFILQLENGMTKLSQGHIKDMYTMNMTMLYC